ncbi:hypothetical protein SLS61_008860 [Didymella pomorum]
MASLYYHVFSPVGIAYSISILLASLALYVVGTAVYNVYFSKLRHIPGPLLARATGIPYGLHMRSGTISKWLTQLHEQYGDVVRVAPTELSFISGETAWPDIYGFRTGKHKNTGAYLKDPTWLNELAEKGKELDIMRWYNYATFDIISDLSFGEPLYCLRDSQEHKWVNMVFKSVMGISIISIRNKYALFRWYDKFRGLFEDNQMTVRARKDFFLKSRDMVSTRLETETDRPDFFSFILQNQEKDNRALTRDEMDSNATIFLVAGSETTATTLSGTTYLLLKNPAAYARLANEIRTAFARSQDITIDAVNNLPYLLATLQEGLRYYPPVPTGFPRVVPGQGQQISGHYVPGGTSVYVSQHAANHSSRNFSEPNKFKPERWLESRPKAFEADKREVVQPFSFGPRNCLGKNLAYAEMRLILAKILFHFDLELVQPGQDWMSGQRVFALWEKPALEVRLTPVVR